jgi:sec-independent protein translocase protein TatB
MFDFAWSEIALIGVVALIAIGPKDLPVAIKAVTGMIKKARRMAAEFQTHVDDMVREADLTEVRNQFRDVRNFDLKGFVERNVDSDGTIRSTLSKNPLDPIVPPVSAAASATTTMEAETVSERPATEWRHEDEAGDAIRVATVAPHEPYEVMTAEAPPEERIAAPSFIPPSVASVEMPPAFLPPGTARCPVQTIRF